MLANSIPTFDLVYGPSIGVYAYGSFYANIGLTCLDQATVSARRNVIGPLLVSTIVLHVGTSHVTVSIKHKFANLYLIILA